MLLVKNYSSLVKTEKRKALLDILESGLDAIQPKNVLEKTFVRNGNQLSVKENKINLPDYNRVFLIGFGKGSAEISQIIEEKIDDVLTSGFVIDTVEQKFSKISFTLGTHPLPSTQNISFTQNVLDKISGFTEKDLVFVVICGGGSAMFESPSTIDREKLIGIFDILLKSGANITEMNVIRKHLSKVKGGGLAKHLFPAKVVSLIFSDVPGNDLSVIASGPTVKDLTTTEDAIEILQKYDIKENSISPKIFTPTTTEDKYFENVSNIIILDNQTALNAMSEIGTALGFKTRIYSDKLEGDARKIGEKLIAETQKGELLLAGGETTIKVLGTGKGGRNQTLVLSALPNLDKDTIILSVDSDGVDFYHFAGAIGDSLTREKAKELDLDLQTFLDNDDSYTFFEKTGDGIFTDRLESNVADLMMILKS